MKLKYLFDENKNITISSGYSTSQLSHREVVKSINDTHNIFNRFIDFGVDVFKILGMRNLSAFVGEVFSKCVEKNSNGLLMSNPHQDGYPDLLLLDKKGIEELGRLKNRMKEKAPFSPFKNGGIEIKATVGSVPTPAQCKKKGFEKPQIGDQRIQLLKSYDWKAHHRETNNLIGLLWDFIDGVPRIISVFYSNNLVENDWSEIIKPKEGGGRTTSVSIMKRWGVKKMYDGTIAVLDDKKYINFLNKYNQSNKL